MTVTVRAGLGLAGDGGRGRSGRGRHTLRCRASQEQTLSGRGARVYTAHRGWLGVVTGISAASNGDILVFLRRKNLQSTCTVAMDASVGISKP